MKIGIVGAGAVGLFVSASLAQQGHRVTVYVRRSEHQKHVMQNGITLQPSNRTFHVHSLLFSELQQEDVLFICVKSYHLEHLLPLLKETTSSLVFLQNGMSHVDLLQKAKLRTTILLASCDHGVLRLSDNTVNHTGKGKISMALYDGTRSIMDNIYENINDFAFPVHIEDNWRSMLSQKLVINAVINPLTALFRVNNGQILKNPFLVNIGKRLCIEAAGVLQLNADEQWKRVKQVAKSTKNNESSMKMDIKNEHLTEIDAISGYLLKHARIEIPYTKFMYERIKAMEWNIEGEEDNG